MFFWFYIMYQYSLTRPYQPFFLFSYSVSYTVFCLHSASCRGIILLSYYIQFNLVQFSLVQHHSILHQTLLFSKLQNIIKLSCACMLCSVYLFLLFMTCLPFIRTFKVYSKKPCTKHHLMSHDLNINAILLSHACGRPVSPNNWFICT